MHADVAMQLLADLFATGLLIGAPVLGITLLVGLGISVLQVVTQIQEASLTFVPKLGVAVVALVALGPWMLRTLTAFSLRLWTGIPSML